VASDGRRSLPVGREGVVADVNSPDELVELFVRESRPSGLAAPPGRPKAPGEFRRTQVWIGPPGCTPDTCSFVPISPEKLPDAFGSWECYLHSEQPDRLVQLAVLHAEFEALHPFTDGNGRLGRMLTPLFLWQIGLISQPMFYISGYLEEHREEYYAGLGAVSRDGDWTAWCRFFLQAVKAQAEDNLQKSRQILELYDHLKLHMVDMTRSPFGIRALDWLFARPIFRTSDFLAELGASERAARRLLEALAGEQVLRALVAGGGRRPSIMAFPALLNIAEGAEVF